MRKKRILRKAQFFGISTLAVWLAFGLVLIMLFGIFTFEKKEKEEALVESFQARNAETLFLSYLRQIIDLDVNDDGKIDAETVADLVVLGYKDERARNAFEQMTSDMLDKVNTFKEKYVMRVVYPSDSPYSLKIPKDMEFSQASKLYLPIPGDTGIETSVGTGIVTIEVNQCEVEVINLKESTIFRCKYR